MGAKHILTIYISSLIVLSVAYILLLYQRRHSHRGRQSDSLHIQKHKNRKNYLFILSRLYVRMPVIRRYYYKIKTKYRALCPADEITLEKKTTARMTFCLSICAGVFCVSSVICKFDFLYSAAGLLICYIFLTILVNSSEEKMRGKLLSQLDGFIVDLNACYHDAKIIEDAISSAMDLQPYEIGLHAQQLYDIVTAADIDSAISSYVDTAPDRHFLLLAAICASVKKYGDKAMEGSRSLFSANLDYLKSDLDMERIRISKRVRAFSGMGISVLLPIFFLKPIEMFMISRFTETRMYYRGMGGIISFALILVSTFVCYESINILKDDSNSYGDSSLLRKIAAIPAVQKYLNRYICHNYSKSIKVADSLKATDYRGSLNVFLLKCLFTSLALFVAVNIVFLFGLSREKEMLFTDYASSYSSSATTNETLRQQMIQLSPCYKDYVKGAYSEEELTDLLYMDIGDIKTAAIMAREFVSRHGKLQGKSYPWYALLLATVAGGVGYYMPYMLLLYRKRVMGLDREDEVAQFRTIILILMHEDGMSINTILEWLEQFAHAFKSSLSDCVINMEYSQQKALERLRDVESGFAPFRRLCESFISADNVGLSMAFDYLESERYYYQKKRELDNARLLDKCRQRAGILMLVPVYEVVALYILIPFIYYAYSILQKFNGII